MIIPQACKTTFGLKAFPNLTFEINADNIFSKLFFTPVDKTS